MSGPRILLVMHNVPLDSGFLSFKFVELSKRMDVHLLVWDKSERIKAFEEKHNLSGQNRKIHSGVYTRSGFLRYLPGIIRILLFNSSARKYLFSAAGSFGRKIRFLAYYMPVFRLRQDVIHFEFGTLAADALTLKKITGAKISVSFRGYDLNYVGLEQEDYYKDVWAAIDGAHFLGNDLKARAEKRGYRPAPVEMIIPPATKTEFFKPLKNVVNEDKLKIISVGRLTWKKGYDIGIRAVALLKKKNIPFEYKIIGDGNFLQPLLFTIHELGLQQEVSLPGSMPHADIVQELQNADVFFHPAISEGFCNAVLEAQAVGLPVVCTDADGLPENIVDMETGFIVPKWDEKAMSERLEWCYNNKEGARNMGLKGISRVEKHFRSEDQVNSFIDFYRKVYASG